MGAVGSFKHVATVTGATAITNAFGNSVAVELSQATLIQSSCFLFLDTIAGGAAKTTVRITSDAAGDECLVPDTEADISVGITTATDGTTVYKTDIVVPAGSNTVYVWVKLDAGSCNLNKVVITGIE